MKHVTSFAAIAAAALALAGCSSDSAEEPDAASTRSAAEAATETAETAEAATEATPSETAEEAVETIVDRIAAEYPTEDWDIADSPALALTAEERSEYLGLALDGEDYEEALSDDSNPDGLSEAQFYALAGMSDELDRAGREILLASMIEQDGSTGMAAGPALSAADMVCSAVEDGASYGEAFGDVFAKALIGGAFESALTDDEAAAEEAVDASASAVSGALFAHLLCPEYTDDAVAVFEQMGEEG
ncbi:hypothetical protein [Demequina pelophila]|uniref:hypothetical protein n=1 Tax=Demequina pelophila TaxID=1638984 RepID=UPI000783A7E1|nr:hypothetical protein [Demequina pelophila]